MKLEVIKSAQGYDNYRIIGEMTEELKNFFVEKGYRWSSYNKCYYPGTIEAKYENANFTEELEKTFFSNNNNDINNKNKEKTVQLEDLIAELREEIRLQKEKIKELESVIEEKNNNVDGIIPNYKSEITNVDTELEEQIAYAIDNKDYEHLANPTTITENEVQADILWDIEDETEIIITEEELEICKKIIPPNQYAYTLELTQGEEGDFYKQKLKDIAKIAKQITTDDELVNNDGTHNVGFHYFVGNSDFYISEIKSDGLAFGYTILNGDIEMAEWGYQDLDEIINASQWIEMDYHVPEGMTIERMLEEKYPEYYKQESVVEIEQQSDVIVPREKIFSIFNKYISNEEYATEKANKFIKGWENKDFNSLAEGLVFKKDTTAELRKLFNETEKVSLPEGNANYLDVYTYLTKFADVETIPAEGKFNTWNDVIDYDIEVRTSLENKKNIFHFFQTHTSQTERTNYLKKEYSNRGGGVLPFNYVYTSDEIYLKALIDGKIKEKSYTWAEYTKFISDKISQGTYYTEPKIEKVTNKLISSFNLLNEKYAMEFVHADEGKIDVNSEADKWIVKFYDISKVVPGEIDKGRFIQKYYASSLLQNQNSTVGLNLGYGWSLDAETFNRAKEIIKDFVSIDMSEIFSSKQNNNDEYSEFISKEPTLEEKIKIAEKEINDRVEKGKNLVKSYILEHWKDNKENGVFDLWATNDAMRYVGFNPEIQNYVNEKYVDVYNQEEKKELEKINQKMKDLLSEYSKDLIKNNNSNKFSFILEKLSAAGIEVVTDKNEFNRILEREELLQKMTEENKLENLFSSDNAKNLNSEIDKLTIKDIDSQDNFIEISKETPFILKECGLDNYPINIYKQKLARAFFLEKEKYGERRTHGHKGEFTSVEAKKVFENISNPRYVFLSRTNINNPDNYYLIGVYDVFDNNGEPMMLSFHFNKNRKEIEANWVTSIYGKNKNILVDDWTKHGYLIYVNDLEIEKAPTEVVTLYMRVSKSASAIDNNIILKSDLVNKMNVSFYKQDDNVYGFAHNGKIYLNPDIVSSEAAIHEYTHLWDNYTKVTNPELWNKGMTCLKGTSLWYEIKEDKNYENLRTDDEILSECHARIVGKMAEQVLERIAARDGELTKDKIIDWDREVNEYVATELLIKPELGDENYISESVKAEYLKEFLSMPMKDLMNEMGFEKEALSFEEAHLAAPMKDLMNGVGFEKEYALLQNNGERKLLTPLGKKSELSEDEWNYAHSSDFKNLYGDWEQKIKQDFLLSEQTVAQLTGNEFSKKEGLSLTDQVEQYFNNINNKIESPFFGNVVLDREGADDSLAHGMGRLKAIAYAGVPDVIKNGVIIDSDFNHKNRGYNSYIIAAPVEIAKEKYICEVVLKQNKNETRFYLHEVTEQKKFLDRAFVTNLAQKPAHQGTMLNILDKTLSVNTEISCPLTVNGEPERKFIEEYIKSINNIQKFEISNENINNDYTDPIEALEESYNTPLNPPTEEDIEAEKILHDKYIQDELDKIIENLQANGGLSDAAIEAEIAAQEEAEAYEEDSFYDEEEEPVQTFNDTNGNPHFPQEIVSILENFQKVEISKWNLPVEEKTAVFHLIQLTEIDKNDFENSLAKLQEYMNTEEFKREEENYAKIFTPILLTSLGQDYDKETQTFSSEKFSYKFSTDELKEEIPVTKGEIKSILDNYFTGGNIKLTQDFQNELIEKGLVKPEEKFVLINEVEAVAKGTKIKPDQPYVTLTIPVNNNGKTEFVQTKYYHVSALEEPQKLEKNVEEAGNQNEAVDKNIIIYGETKVPEFAIITQHGLKTYSNLIIESYDPTSHSYLLQSEDGSQRLNITEETYNELMSNTFQKKAQSFTNDEPAYNKLLETQYNDYFKQRDNTAYNFKHNLSVYCRKEANSPCNALEIAKGIISRMSVEEKNKTKKLLSKMANNKTINEVIVDIYHEAIKEVPLNEEYIKMKVPEKVIARPFYDTVSNNGQLISKDYNLKIGDTLKNVNISSEKLFGKGTENIKFDELKIISSSKEGNCITLMDSNKSFVEIPLDTVLSSYEKYKSNTQKIEKRNTVSMDISY